MVDVTQPCCLKFCVRKLIVARRFLRALAMFRVEVDDGFVPLLHPFCHVTALGLQAVAANHRDRPVFLSLLPSRMQTERPDRKRRSLDQG